jgi:hypothetical protein
MFGVLFRLVRLLVWIALCREMISDPRTKIDMPGRVYTGHAERQYTSIRSVDLHHARDHRFAVSRPCPFLHAPSAADRCERVSSRDERKPMAIWTAPGGIRVRGVPTLDALQPPTSDVTRITVSARLG